MDQQKRELTPLERRLRETPYISLVTGIEERERAARRVDKSIRRAKRKGRLERTSARSEDFANSRKSLSRRVTDESVFRVIVCETIGDPASPDHWTRHRNPKGSLLATKDLVRLAVKALP